MKYRYQGYTHKKQIVCKAKNHPFVVPVITLVLLSFITGMLSLVFGGGTVVGPSDSRVVTIYMDQTKQIIPTRAKTVAELLQRRNITIKEGDVVEPSLDTLILDDNFTINIYRSRPVVLIDNNKRIAIDSADQSPRIAARKAGIIVYPEDEIRAEAPEDLLGEGVVGERYVIDRATPVTLILYGNVSGVRTQSKTVGELLKEKNISLESGDTVAPSTDTQLQNDMKITITREGQRIETVEEAIAPPIEYVDDSYLTRGQEVVREPGSPGKQVVVYNIKLENDQVVSREVIEKVVTINPQRKLVARGTKIIISNPSENVQIGQQLAAGRGWTGQEFYCLYQLWQKESGWNTTSGNPNTGAYGIPQALPGSKMASAGADWRTNPATQITWGMGYIAGRYGTPCAAYAVFQARGWY